MTYSEDKTVLDLAQEYFESIDNSGNERTDEEIERDNQKAQEWIDELDRKLKELNS